MVNTITTNSIEMMSREIGFVLGYINILRSMSVYFFSLKTYWREFWSTA